MSLKSHEYSLPALVGLLIKSGVCVMDDDGCGTVLKATRAQ